MKVGEVPTTTAARRTPRAAPAAAVAARAGRALAAPLAGAVPVVWLGFNAGGFFAGTTGLAAVVAGAALLLWVMVAPRPFAGITIPLAAAAGALGALAVWTLASSAWSDAAARAILEFDRTLLYLVGVVLAGLAFAAVRDRRGLVWGFAAGCVLVVGAGLVTRVLPEVWSIRPNIQADRLSYPVTYWNTLGLLAALGMVACIHLTASEREPRPARVLGAAATPLLAAALFFTFSRGAIAAVPFGVLAYLVLARPRGALSALVAVVPATAFAVVSAYDADALSSATPTSALAISQGEDLALVLVLCALVAAVLRAVLLPLDTRLSRIRVSRGARRRIGVGLALVALLAVAVPATALDAPGWVDRQYERFTEGDTIAKTGDRRDRLIEPGNNGRLDHWDAALEGYRRNALTGTGAGTYVHLWLEERPYNFNVTDAHSLYLEVLGELGLVGLALLLLAIAALLVGIARRIRGPDRALAAAAFALLLVWAARAGIDWDWEMPVVTLPILAIAGATAGGAALRDGDRDRTRFAAPAPLARLLIGLGCLLVLLTPALVWLSQRQFDDSLRAFRAGDCRTAVDKALASTGALSMRPEPFEILGYCDVAFGQPALAVRAFEAALDRDPDNWELHYGLAIARASGGQDPRPALREAQARNPRSDLVREAARRFAGDDPRTWRRRALGARLPV
jgi:hypothetical protein